jgi:hypothetical protein
MNFSKTLTAGTIGAVSLLALGATAFAQNADTTSAPADFFTNRVRPTLDASACAAVIDLQTTVIAPAEDKRYAGEKAARTKFTSDLKAALSLTDETARTTAIEAAQSTMRDSMKAVMEQFDTDTEDARNSLRTSCAGLGMMGGMHMMKGGFPGGHGGMPGMKFMKHFRSGEVDGEMTEGEETFFQRMEDQHKNQAQ